MAVAKIYWARTALGRADHPMIQNAYASKTHFSYWKHQPGSGMQHGAVPCLGRNHPRRRVPNIPWGKGANKAVAAARLGYRVRMVGKVGDDEFGRRLRAGVASAGPKVRHVTTAQATSSGVAFICLGRRGQNSIVVAPGANGKLLPADLDKATPLLRSAGIILTQLDISFETVAYLPALASPNKSTGSR